MRNIFLSKLRKSPQIDVVKRVAFFLFHNSNVAAHPFPQGFPHFPRKNRVQLAGDLNFGALVLNKGFANVHYLPNKKKSPENATFFCFIIYFLIINLRLR